MSLGKTLLTALVISLPPLGLPAAIARDSSAVTPSVVLHGPAPLQARHLTSSGVVRSEESTLEAGARIKDPASIGGHTLEEATFRAHDDGPMAWERSPGRESAPGSADATYAALE